jgi:seryl-tRNA synthetase
MVKVTVWQKLILILSNICKLYQYYRIYMDISYILDNAELYADSILKRNGNTSLIEQIQKSHKEYVDALFELDKFRQAKNKINGLMRLKTLSSENIILDETMEQINIMELEKYSRQDLIYIGRYVKNKIDECEQITKMVYGRRNTLVSLVPNLLNSHVSISNDEENNMIVSFSKKAQTLQTSCTTLLNHFDICKKLDILADGSGMAGHRGYFLTGAGVRLNYALINYALEFLDKHKSKVVYTPHFMNKDIMQTVCQLSEFQETLYELKNEDKFLIATSEQPLTWLSTQIDLSNLPVKLGGVSTCYRKEAGSHGKDTMGIFRVHQFEKVEQFCITDELESHQMFLEMIQTSQEFYESLGLSYRVISIVSGALNNAAAIKYDLEGLFRGTDEYRELVSCSNTTDYFSRKLNVKDKHGKYVHMLNSTLCANTRTICCILEEYQTDTGVVIPEVLRKYIGLDCISYVN